MGAPNQTTRYDLRDVSASVYTLCEQLGLTTDRFAHLMQIDPTAFDEVMHQRLPSNGPETVLCRLYFGAGISAADPHIILGTGPSELHTWLAGNVEYIVSTADKLARIKRRQSVTKHGLLAVCFSIVFVVLSVIAIVMGTNLSTMVTAGESLQELTWPIVWMVGSVLLATMTVLLLIESYSNWKVRRNT